MNRSYEVYGGDYNSGACLCGHFAQEHLYRRGCSHQSDCGCEKFLAFEDYSEPIKIDTYKESRREIWRCGL